MNKQAKMMLAGMYSSFPQSTEVNPDAYLFGLTLACEDVSDEAIIQAVKNVVSGTAEGINPNFSPSTAAFGVYARKIETEMQLIRRAKERPALPKPTYEPSATIKQEGTEEDRKARVAAIMGKFRKEDQHAN